MRSEVEIRRQVETRIKRWASVLLNGGAWAAVALGLYLYSRVQNVPAGWIDSAVLAMLLWGALVGLHFAHGVYTEMRESLVRRAIEREREFYRLKAAYEKRKRDESFPRNANGSRPRIADDGELIDFPVSSDDDVEVKAKHER